VSNLFHAWSVDAQGLLPWLATAHALSSFERQLPPRWGGEAYRIGRVEELGSRSFEANVKLVVGRTGSKNAAVCAITLVFGPAMSLGGEPIPLLLTDVLR
jgi:hypothetical protein